MPELTMETKTVNVVDAFDLNAFMNATYPQLNGKFDFVSNEEAYNDSAQTYSVTPNSGKSWDKLNEWDIKDIEDGNCKFRSHVWLNYAASQGLIPEGEYVIEVSW